MYSNGFFLSSLRYNIQKSFQVYAKTIFSTTAEYDFFSISVFEPIFSVYLNVLPILLNMQNIFSVDHEMCVPADEIS